MVRWYWCICTNLHQPGQHNGSQEKCNKHYFFLFYYYISA